MFFVRKGLGVSYLKGLLDGFTLSFSAKGRQHKVRFRVTRLGNYLWIQGQLWLNMIRRLKGREELSSCAFGNLIVKYLQKVAENDKGQSEIF